MNSKYQIAVLAGDYIGPEIMASGLQVLKTVSENTDFDYEISEVPFGGQAIDQTNDPLPDATLETCQNSDAILLAAIGGPKWDGVEKSPESGLLRIRQELGLFTNIRPTIINSTMKSFSPIKITEPIDFVIVRELTSGIYFGQPREKSQTQAIDTMRYSSEEIRRVAKVAFDMAMQRNKHVTLVDKANVLATSKLWREVVIDVAREYPEVKYDTSYVDSAAMKIISKPGQFDVILTENLFGDILSDEAAQITGSLGTIPSMSKGEVSPALYEPIHGSAPDIAGKGIANPLSMIKSVAMMLQYSFGRMDLAKQIMTAVDKSVDKKIVTPDLGGDYSTTKVTEFIVDSIKESRKEYVTK
ncbi:3-isopropylmalate dehydrogenase [Companilactobacillus allii]|uniref:3-isopropylmalate dehydrogenase n=1 Tax=Companilactobacillus allii TaxID=1847728 RepID=A0A1P8Q085_9LACO|nr:3-isopropylmalate dehydrogenase [Companilactobacillus allii]APX71282.1 3-isopropylmalate dehydrogenase [Companilactobacillus allii]USQ68364.1 3-isopropylmalate dehydrogenase [Companilactobacillus allii]